MKLEAAPCYACGSDAHTFFTHAWDDLHGEPGTFTFVTCNDCGLAYQRPRIPVDSIRDYYVDEYIAYRKQTRWGVLQPFYDWAMSKHDRDKDAICQRWVSGLDTDSAVLDVGCAVGSWLLHLKDRYGCRITGVDFKDCSHFPRFDEIDFHLGLFYELPFGSRRFDLITMWHFLEHDYDPARSLVAARDLLAPGGHLIIEVPRLDSLTFRLYGKRWPGLQAPQHTVLLDKKRLLTMVKQAGLEVVEYLPWGAFPAYFYLFCGAAFTLNRGRGLSINRWIWPYVLGQAALAPVMIFEKRLNLAMQTLCCRSAP